MLLKKLQLNRLIIKTLAGLVFSIMLVLRLTTSVSAANGANFSAGRIVDDAVFTNTGTMSITDIQLFLNSKVPNCQPGFTCLKNYVENGKSSAQIIWEQSNYYGINPQVILVTLQKENGLITDTYPYDWQYRTAMGFACPDGGSCDPAYYGFTNQVGQGARHFKNYFDNNPNWFIPYTPGQSTIKWHPNGGCGTSSVYIENKATAALYSYTPYRPNQAALNNLYGLGDGCSSYGNRNFWRDFTDWFGSTYSSEYITQVIQAPGDSRYFLRIGNTKMWIPSTELYTSWKLNDFPVLQVTTPFFDSLSLLPNLKQVGRAGPYYYFVSNGQKHYIPTGNHLSLWGFTQQDIDRVPATTVLNNIPEGDHLGRFAKSSNTEDTDKWIINANQKNKITGGDMLYQWGYVANQEIIVTPEFLATKSTGPEITRYISSGGSKYIIDTARKINLSSTSQIENWGNPTFTEINSNALVLLPTTNYSNFLKPANDNKWYLLDSGKKRYLPNSNVLNTWGYTNNLLNISSNLSDTLINATDARSIVRVITPSDKTYIIDGEKHWVPDGNTLAAWENDSNTIDIYSEASVSHLANGSNASTIYQIKNTPHIYTIDDEKVRHIPDGNTLNAWGYPRLFTINNLSQAFVYQYQQTTPASYKVDTGVNKYLLEDGYSHSATGDMISAWGLSSTTNIAASTLARFGVGPTLNKFASAGGTNYLIDSGNRVGLGTFSDAFGVSPSNTTTLNKLYLPQAPSAATFLLQSTNQADTRIWLISQGNKYYIESFAKLVNYGFISRQLPITKLSQATIDSFTDSGENAPIFIKKSGSGTKLINFGAGAGFPDSTTKAAYGSNNTTDEVVSASIFDYLTLTTYLQVVAQGYDGKIYLIENGTKRWIVNSQLYSTNYTNLPKVLLYGTTLEMIPNGANIN